jgi:sugar/nucleoside kinase (ribokinase family)
MFDLISIGDCVIDTFVPLEDVEILTEKAGSFMKIPLGGKLPVGPSVTSIGGNAANCAISTARLKLKTAIYTCVGKKDDDQADHRIVGKFKAEGVDTRYVVEDKEFVSNHHVVLSYKGERTILTYHQPWRYNLPDLDQTKWIYLTSLSPSYVNSNIVDQLVNHLERMGGKLAYQPGTFQLKQGKKNNARLLSLADFFILNLEEAKEFLGLDEKESVGVKKILKLLADLGPKQVVVTDGKNGAYGFDGENYWKLETFPAQIVQVTGAGDAFASATLAGLFYGEQLKTAMRWGAANSASVIEQTGPTLGLLSYNKIQERLKQNAKIVAKSL